MQSSTQHKHKNRVDRKMNRRTFMKATGAAAGTAAVAAGSSTGAIPSPVGRSEAAAPVAVAAGLLLVGGVGYLAGRMDANKTSDVDASNVIEDQFHDAASLVASERKSDREEWKNEFLNRSSDKTPWSSTAWQEIETTIAEARANDKSQSEAVQECRNVLDKHYSKTVINVVEHWNRGVKELAPYMFLANSDGSTYLKDGGVSGTQDTSTLSDNSNWDYVRAAEYQPDDPNSDGTIDGDIIVRGPVNLPVDPSKIEGRDKSLQMWVWGKDASGLFYGVAPNPSLSNQSTNFDTAYLNQSQDSKLVVTHPNRDNVTALDSSVHSGVLTAVENEKERIGNNLTTYVQTLYQSFSEGLLSPEDLISPTDIYEQFSTSSSQSRVAAGLIAAGANVPQGAVDMQAKVSHPDLQSNSVWGNLYIMSSSAGADIGTVTAGTTISSSNYSMAYLGFPSDVDGSYTTVLLSGSSDLKILDTEGYEGEEPIAKPDQTAGSSGRVVIWDTNSQGEAPEWLKNAGSGDYSGIKFVINGANNSSTHPASEITENGGEYILSSTSLNQGETVESIRPIYPSPFKSNSQYVDDVTTFDSGAFKDRMQSYQELIEALESDSSVGGGVFDGSGLPLPAIFGFNGWGTAGAGLGGLWGIGKFLE